LHFSGVIECIILVDRLKNFMPFVKRVFTVSPKKTTVIFFFICLIIDFAPIFQYSAYDFDYNYYDNKGDIQTYKVYILIASEIASSYIGSSIQITSFVIRDGVTLAISIVLNIICFIKMKRQMARKEVLTNETSNRVGVTSSSQVTDIKKEREKAFQKNMYQMTITLVVNSSLVRITTLTCGIYWLFAYDLIAAILGVSADTAIALNAMVPFFVYLRFNRKYRKIFLKLLFGSKKKKTRTPPGDTHTDQNDEPNNGGRIHKFPIREIVID
jgi:hypothetical protein